MQGIHNPLFGMSPKEPRRVISTFIINTTLRGLNLGFKQFDIELYTKVI